MHFESSAVLRLFIVVCVAIQLAACATSTDRRPDESASRVDTSQRRGFMGLDDGPLEADWEEWTPEPGRAADDIAPIRSFDVWHLTDRAEMEQLWGSFFSLVSFGRNYVPADVDPTYRAILTLLDPSASDDVATDFVFFVGADRATEGVIVRTHRTLENGGTVGLVLELRRDSGQGDNPSTIVLHMHSGFAETPSIAVDLARADEIAYRLPDATTPRWITVEGEELATELMVVRDIVTSTFWRPIIGNGYVDPPFDVVRAEKGTPSVDFPTGHGVEPDLRPIDRVWTDTVFPPRVDLPAPAKDTN